MKMQWQYSDDTTAVTDQFGLTGADRLRGFRPSLFSADSSVLLAMNWYLSSVDWFEQNAYATNITPFWFVDYGYGEQNLADFDNEWAEFSDIGAGLDFAWQGGLRSKITVAQPTTSRISYTDDDITSTRLYIEIIWQID
jgi:hemolysin activation/secretion protein